LQQAQLKIVNNMKHPEWEHPYYWAPFILIGDWK
jgi:CHAT domain-containing protein